MKVRPLTTLKTIRNCNGLEILRNLVQTFHHELDDGVEGIWHVSAIVVTSTKELDRISDKYPESIKLAVLTRSITGQLKK